MTEDAFKIISLVFEDAGPDGGADHRHDALILIDLPTDDRPAQISERTCANSSNVSWLRR
jgi:hypothetical protein